MKKKIITLFLIIFFTAISSGLCATRGVKLTPGEVEEEQEIERKILEANAPETPFVN